MLCLFALSSCAGFQHRCDSSISPDCLKAERLWQKSIDSIVSKNFPAEFGTFKAVIWEDSNHNAWVTKGTEINITRPFLHKLNNIEKKCVVAHELAHLKMGHYYAKKGIIILDDRDRRRKRENAVGHYGQTLNIEVPKGFGEDQEKEADRLALAYLERSGINKRIYLNLLTRIRTGYSVPDPNIIERIQHIKKIIFGRK